MTIRIPTKHRIAEADADSQRRVAAAQQRIASNSVKPREIAGPVKPQVNVMISATLTEPAATNAPHKPKKHRKR